VTPSSPDFPVDHELPGAAALAGADALRDHLRCAAPEAAAEAASSGVTQVRFRYVEHEPGRSMLVLARATVADTHRLVAASLGRTAPVDAGVQLAWYPNDSALPALVAGVPAFEQRLELTVDIANPLAWVPHRRLVVAAGETIVKLHATPTETNLAVEHAARAAAAVDVPRVVAAMPDVACHLQERVMGQPLGRRDVADQAVQAAGVLHRLRALDATDLAVHTPADLLRDCEPVVRLVGLVGGGVAVFDQLTRTKPGGIELVPSHGDFNVGQLLRRDDGTMVVVDTDTLCRAPDAYDVAAYAANLLGGRLGDLAGALDSLDRMCGAYGVRPEGLDWYMAAMALRRSDRAVRRWKTDWRTRTERLLAAAEWLAARIEA
jgi:hypothetical protein